MNIFKPTINYIRDIEIFKLLYGYFGIVWLNEHQQYLLYYTDIFELFG